MINNTKAHTFKDIPGRCSNLNENNPYSLIGSSTSRCCLIGVIADFLEEV